MSESNDFSKHVENELNNMFSNKSIFDDDSSSDINEPAIDSNINLEDDEFTKGLEEIVNSVKDINIDKKPISKPVIKNKLRLSEEQIKNLLYYSYLENIDIPKKLVQDNDIQEILDIMKKNLSENKYIELKRKLNFYTHFNNRNAIDLSDFQLKDNNTVKCVNIDYESLIGKKIPFFYQNIKGVITVVSVSVVYTERASELIDNSYKRFEEQYGSNRLLIVNKFLCKYKNKTVWISVRDIEKVNLRALFQTNK